MKKYLVIGGVAGGASTAARIRRLDESAKIIMFERGDYISYANCGLPYYIGGTIAERSNLFVTTPEIFNAKMNVDVRVKSDVIAIDRAKKTVKVKNLSTGTVYEESYDRLMLSPGAEPVRPPIPGIDNDRVFTLRNVADTDAIKNFVTENKPKRAVVIGAGFIGLETAENLHELGIEVTVVEMLDQVLAPIDFDMASIVHQHIRSKGVELILKDGVSSFEKNVSGVSVKLTSGSILNADIIILSIGVKPDTKLAKEAGISLNDRGAIVVNEYLQTNDENIYAVGDAIVFENKIINQKVNTLLAGPANKQARIAADNMVSGNKKKYGGALGTAIVKVFDITVASTGFPEKYFEKAGIKCISNITHSGNHAGYYPMSIPLSLKLVFSPDDGKILGAQSVGYEGVDKRIDVISALIGKGGTVYDLEEFEHCYAPPFSSAKDPVNIAGFSAENILSGMMKIVKWKDISGVDSKDLYLLDVRSKDENALGKIAGSINIPIEELRKRINEVPKDKKVVVYCAVGQRGYLSCRILMQNGYENVYNLTGGYKTYEYITSTVSLTEKSFIGSDNMLYLKNDDPASIGKTISVDACGLQCPGPIMKLKKEIDLIKVGERISVKATDPGFKKDSVSWCALTGNALVSIEESAGVITAVIQKADKTHKSSGGSLSDNKTIVVFSNDFDRALASFVIANGAAASGKKVTMFFTFWGLTVLKDRKAKNAKKDIFGKMFGMMLPKGSQQLQLSKMSFGGMGVKMMRFIMKLRKIDSLESMIISAKDAGVEMIACQMSMDVMGVKKEELYDFVKIGGVAAYLEEADNANMNLFI